MNAINLEHNPTGVNQNDTKENPQTNKKNTPTFKLSFESKIIFLVSFVICFLFLDIITPYGFYGLPMVLTTLIYVGLIEFLAHKKQIRHTKESIFWLVLLVLHSLSTLTPYENALLGWLTITYLFIAFYWAACYFKILTYDKSSSFFLQDIFHIFYLIPIKNSHIISSLWGFLIQLPNSITLSKNAKSILVGLVLSVLLCIIILPLLIYADGTGKMEKFFSKDIVVWLTLLIPDNALFLIFKSVMSYILAIVLSIILISFYAYLQIDYLKQKAKSIKLNNFQVISPVSILTVLMLASVVYISFIVLQLPYFFSALGGKLPDNLVYSAYARRGFFELCILTAINFLIIISIHIFTDKLNMTKLMPMIRIGYLILSIITLVLIAIAFSKMMLYISAYHLTIKRVVVCLTLIYFGIIWVAFIIKQFYNLPVTKIAILIGALFATLMTTSHLNVMIERYNVAQLIEYTPK